RRSVARLSDRTQIRQAGALRSAWLRCKWTIDCATVAASFPEWTRNRNDLREGPTARYNFEHRGRVVVANLSLRNYHQQVLRTVSPGFSHFQPSVSVARRRRVRCSLDRHV